jgi:flagellar biosynthesis protein FlhF
VLSARVECVASDDELVSRIQALSGRLVLVDTPGLPARNAEAAARFGALRQRSSALQLMLVLPASVQSGVLGETVQHFTAVAHCCALTRVDESVSLGGAISALVRSQLPVAYISDGPSIPDDLKPARAHQIVAQAIELSRQAQGFADDEVLARRYGASIHATG